MKILVTRPEPTGKKLCGLIDANPGLTAIHYPTIKTLPSPENIPSTEQIAQQDIVIFISPNAVVHCQLNFMPHYPTVIAMGPGTADELTACRWPIDAMPITKLTSEGLLELDQLQDCAGKHIMIVKGGDGRNLIETALKAKGANVTLASVYQQQIPSSMPEIDINNIDVILATSESALRNLIGLIEDKTVLLSKRLLLSSDRLAGIAEQLGFSKISIANNASNPELLKALATIGK